MLFKFFALLLQTIEINMVKRSFKKVYRFLIRIFFSKISKTAGTAAPITFKTYLFQKILGFNRKVYWPTHFTSVIANYKNIKIGIGTAPGLSPGCYIQGGGEIYIGDYTIIAANVGIISANHDVKDITKHKDSKVIIGNYSWLGMNSVVLPNVILGDYTIVGAGAVVTKSFEEGYCVIAGNPAKIIKKLNKEECVHFENDYKYYGYIPSEKFATYREKELNV